MRPPGRAAFLLLAMILSTLWLTVLPASWLLPNHYFPWVSAWAEGIALAGLAAGLVTFRRLATVPRSLTVGACLALVVITVQSAIGYIAFKGDGLMAGLYIAAFVSAIGLGVAISLDQADRGASIGSVFAQAISVCSIVSVGISLVQWTGAASLGIWGVDMPPGGRPYGNVAQPNHLSTICFLGLCSLALLHERARIGSTGLVVGALWLLLGMVMTGSRTGWLQMAALVLMVALLHKRSALKLGVWPVLAAAAVYAATVAAWPAINEAMALTAGRSAQEVSSGGTRPLHWAAMLAAIQQEPWFGYGWQQVSVAQVRTADTQPYVGEYIEHSHNLFLDLLIWNGLPVGLLLCGILVWWFVTRWARCRDATVFWLMACITGLAAHAMVEYPLSFAYFLIPMGFWMGAVDALQGRQGGFVISARWVRAAGLVFGALLAWVAVDYLKAEQGYRLLRLESARVGVTGLTTPPPQLQLLTQLEAFQRFAHTEARAGMSADELDQMRKVSERYAYPPSLFRYALAQGLNGQAKGAELTLLRLCRIHPRERCDEGREAWVGLQQRHAQLQGIVYPPTPPTAVLK